MRLFSILQFRSRPKLLKLGIILIKIILTVSHVRIEEVQKHWEFRKLSFQTFKPFLTAATLPANKGSKSCTQRTPRTQEVYITLRKERHFDQPSLNWTHSYILPWSSFSPPPCLWPLVATECCSGYSTALHNSTNHSFLRFIELV